MEKFSSVDRIVGNVSEEKRSSFLEKMRMVFEERNIKALTEAECIKTPKQLEVLSLVNKGTNELRHKYGLEDFDIPPENIHIIKKDIWDVENISAGFFPKFQRVMIGEKDRLTTLAKAAFHEETHFKSYGAFQKPKDSENIIEYRCGIQMYPRSIKKLHSGGEDTDIDYFRDLNEAITEECTRRWVLSHLDDPLFQKEQEETELLRQCAREKLDLRLLDPDVFDINFDRKTDHLEWNSFSYKDYRQALYQIINSIFEKYPDKFKDKDEVFDVFARAALTGHMMEMGHLMEKTFGKGTMRKIAEP